MVNENHRKMRVAAIVTEYRYNSHTEVILGRLLGSIEYQSRLEVVALYTDQVPENDMSREEAQRCGIPIYPTIGEAVRAGGLTIDGILVIGEHGDYPWNEKRQKMYPRRRLIEETLRAMDQLGLNVPIFSDKHLAYDIQDALWIYRQIKQRNIPFLGGSSIPLTDHWPEYDRSWLQTAKEWFVVSWLGIESYGFHGMEVLQSLAEKRSGGESGVKSVHAIEGHEVWTSMERHEWPEQLLLEALAVLDPAPKEHPKDVVGNPVVFVIEYLDGSKGYVIQLEEFVRQWSFASRSDQGITAARCLTSGRPYIHFERLTQTIEDLICLRQSSVPIERTMITTGLIDYGMESLYLGRPIETPELHISYKV